VINGEPIQSIHTHWYQRNDLPTFRFNQWVLSQLQKLTSVKKTKSLISFLEHQHSFLKIA
jgi:hypothetical protein